MPTTAGPRARAWAALGAVSAAGTTEALATMRRSGRTAARGFLAVTGSAATDADSDTDGGERFSVAASPACW